MSFDKFTGSTHGMVFSIDLMLALIIITVILGVSADAMDIVSSKMEDYSYGNSLERIAQAGADMLVKTPGNPENWEKFPDINGVTPGLSDMDLNKKIHSNVISMVKVKRLEANYDTLMEGKVIPSHCKSTLVIYPVDQSLKPINVKIGGNDSSTEVFVENRTVLCNYLNTTEMVFINARDQARLSLQKQLGDECPHSLLNGNQAHKKVDYKKREAGWVCYPFRVTEDMLNSTDFYLMTEPVSIEDPVAVWMIDRPENRTDNNTQFFQKNPILLNGMVEWIMGNNSNAVLWLHVYSSGNPDNAFNTYLAAFPKGTPLEDVKVQYLTPQPCYFVFKVWA